MKLSLKHARLARHSGDAEGVEEISPGLADSERPTPGISSYLTRHFRAQRGE